MGKEEIRILLVQELSKYVKDKHTQEECIGFIDGFKKAIEIIN